MEIRAEGGSLSLEIRAEGGSLSLEIQAEGISNSLGNPVRRGGQKCLPSIREGGVFVLE